MTINQHNCDCNGLFTDRSDCNPFRTNMVLKTKYLGLANKALTVAEALDVYVTVLTEKITSGENTLVCLVNETLSILHKMNTLFPCIYAVNKCDNQIMRTWNWSANDGQPLPTGLFLLTPESHCGLGPVRIDCCPANFFNVEGGDEIPYDFSTAESICDIKLNQRYIDLWCCTAQHLRSIAAFIQEYYCC